MKTIHILEKILKWAMLSVPLLIFLFSIPIALEEGDGGAKGAALLGIIFFGVIVIFFASIASIVLKIVRKILSGNYNEPKDARQIGKVTKYSSYILKGFLYIFLLYLCYFAFNSYN